jgi:protein-tyrosine-phosphatase
MAEGFANHYGSDVLIATSSGVAPVQKVIPETVAIMNEVNVDISGHVPRWYDAARAGEFDVVVNRQTPVVYRRVRADLENRVMQLILRLRARRR